MHRRLAQRSIAALFFDAAERIANGYSIGFLTGLSDASIAGFYPGHTLEAAFSLALAFFRQAGGEDFDTVLAMLFLSEIAKEEGL